MKRQQREAARGMELTAKAKLILVGRVLKRRVSPSLIQTGRVSCSSWRTLMESQHCHCYIHMQTYETALLLVQVLFLDNDEATLDGPVKKYMVMNNMHAQSRNVAKLLFCSQQRSNFE